MRGRVRIRAISGPINGQEFLFEEHDVLLFGRAPGCHARLPESDRTASRHHFILEVNPPDIRLRDLGSLNGTFVNATRYGGRNPEETPEQGARRDYPQLDLRDGDEIRCGETILKVQVEQQTLCAGCGASLSGLDISSQEAGRALCPACRARPQPVAVHRAGPEPSNCARCGKLLPLDVQAPAGVEVICASCQAREAGGPHTEVVEPEASERPQVRPRLPDVPGYQIERRLDSGGFGTVYLARHLATDRQVALKIMLSRVAVSERARAYFLREIELTAALRHPNIVELFDHGAAGAAFYFSMELCQGGNVTRLMRERGGRIPLEEAVPLIVDTLEGLAFVHAREIVHRDLKPQNLLLAEGTGRAVAKVGDFGLAKGFIETGLGGMTATGTYAGSWPFMPREQLTNFKRLLPVSDVWSIAATFYVMLTGQVPRQAAAGQRLDPARLILEGRTVPLSELLPDIPSEVAGVIDQALAVDTKIRYKNAAEMLTALRKALG